MKKITTYREEDYGFFLDSGDERLLGVNKQDGTILIESSVGAGAIPTESTAKFHIRSAHGECTLGIKTTNGFIPIGLVAHGDYSDAQYWVTEVNMLRLE